MSDGFAGGSSSARAYSTDPSRVQHGLQEMQKIADAVQEMLREFNAGLAATGGWTGKDDSFARENTPRVAMEDQASGDTIKSVAGTIDAIADATASNVSSIRSNQAEVQGAIQDEARRSSGHGRR